MTVAMMVAALALGAGEPQADIGRTEFRLPVPSEWIMERFEVDGLSSKTTGKMKLNRNGTGELEFVPWPILGSTTVKDAAVLKRSWPCW